MPRKPDTPCAVCGKLLYGSGRGKGSLPAGERTCQDCRREHPLPYRQQRAERALSASRNACRRGHKFTTENTYINQRGYRNCRECQRGRDSIRHTRERSAGVGLRINLKLVGDPSLLCIQCGKKNERRSDYCSAKCQRQARSLVFRHVVRSLLVDNRSEYELFTHLEIAERDGWKCHLCRHRVTNKTWSIDHLIPICAGGEHTRVNVAIAHKTCNERRQQFGTVQLRLVG